MTYLLTLGTNVIVNNTPSIKMMFVTLKPLLLDDFINESV